MLRTALHTPAMLCRLVAHHSCALIEAGERGLADVLSLKFEPAPQALSSVLTYCDMTPARTASSCRSKGDSPRSIAATATGTWSAGQSSAPRR